MKYEVFWKPHSAGSGCDIEADSAEEARERFVEMVRDNASTADVIANNLDTDNGCDPV